jgi:predicted MFS family arabinose efflux permease
MFLVLLCAYSVNAMDRMIFPVLLTDIREEYGFGLPAAGLQSTMFALGMGLTGVPAGLLLRRISRKSVIVTGTLVFSAATLLTVLSAGFADMLVWRVLSGVGEALQLAAIFTVAAGAFVRHRGLAIGAVNTAFAAGAVLGPWVGVALRDHHDTWRSPMIAFGAVGLALAALVLLVVSPRLTEARAGDATESTVRHEGGATRVLSWNPLVLAVMTALFGLVDFAYIGMYATYAREGLGLTAAQAGFAIGVSGLAAFASPVGGWLVDRLDPRTVLATLCVAQAVSGAALFFGPASIGWQAAWSGAFGLFASSGMYVGLASSLVKAMHCDHASRASGLFITCIYVAAGVAGLGFSWLVDIGSWQSAGAIQIVGLSLVSAALATTLRRDDFSRIAPTGAAA